MAYVCLASDFGRYSSYGRTVPHDMSDEIIAS
jgi:hypothetical protein